MQITKQADYAIRAVLHLTQTNSNGRSATKTIAEKQHISPSFLAKIISQLSIAGLLNTSRGAMGGVSLSRPPEEISILEVVEAIDGPIRLNECVHSDKDCQFGEECPIRPVWCDAQAELVAKLRNTTFDTFVSKK